MGPDRALTDVIQAVAPTATCASCLEKERLGREGRAGSVQRIQSSVCAKEVNLKTGWYGAMGIKRTGRIQSSDCAKEVNMKTEWLVRQWVSGRTSLRLSFLFEKVLVCGHCVL